MPVGPEGHANVEERQGDRDTVKGRPFAAGGDETGRHQWPNGAAYSVRAVEDPQARGVAGQVGAEGIVESKVDGFAETCSHEVSINRDPRGRFEVPMNKKERTTTGKGGAQTSIMLQIIINLHPPLHRTKVRQLTTLPTSPTGPESAYFPSQASPAKEASQAPR